MSTEQQNDGVLSFNVTLATDLLQYLIFSFFFFAIKLCVVLHADDRFTKNKAVQIYIYVFTVDLPSNDECSRISS